MKKLLIKNNLFTMRTQGCEAEILEEIGFRYRVKILTQPNNHVKALPIGKIITVCKQDVEVLQHCQQ